jgi:hypothetical protein
MEPGPEGELVHRPRKVRCKLCRNVWAALPEEEPLELDDPMPPDDGPRPVGAAWASVAGWPTPEPVSPPPVAFGTTPAVFPAPRVPLPEPEPEIAPEPVRAAEPEALPSPAPDVPIHFESVPVPLPSPARQQPAPAPRPRLLGPGARAPEPEPEPEPEPDPEAGGPMAEDWDEEEEPPRRRWPWVVGALLLLLAGAMGLVLTGRVDPRDYGLPAVPTWADPAKMGLPAISLPRKAPPPLALEAKVVRRALPEGRQVWEISGTIVNPTDKRLPVPAIEVKLVDAGGAALGRWTVRPELQNLAPGGVARFETSAIDPPATSVKVRVQLKPAELGRL